MLYCVSGIEFYPRKHALKMRPDQERVRNLLTDTVTLLCKNGLQYQTELRVQGVLGITLDNNDVFIVHINEKFGGDIGGAISIRNDEGDAAKTLLGGKQLDANRGDTFQGVSTKAAHKRRRRSREGSASPTNGSQQHILQQPIKRPVASNREPSPDSIRNRSFHNSSVSDSAFSGGEEVVEMKPVKTEDDVIIVEENEDTKNEPRVKSQNILYTGERSAMQDSYAYTQGNRQPFGDVIGATDISANSDGTAPPPIKRRATTDSTQDSYSGSSEMGPDGSGPFVTGIMRNETLSSAVAPQTTTATSWDTSQVPDFGSLSARDSQMILDSIPGCSTWDTSQQSTMRTPTSHSSLQNTPDQTSESVGVYFLTLICMSPRAEIITKWFYVVPSGIVLNTNTY